MARLTFVIQSRTLTGNDIGGRMDLRPTAVVEKGDPVSRRRPDGGRHRHTVWQLDSGLPDSAEPAEHLAALLPLVEPRVPALRHLQAAGATAFWSCSVTARPTGNLLRFEPGILARLGEIGAALELDLYDSDE